MGASSSEEARKIKRCKKDQELAAGSRSHDSSLHKGSLPQARFHTFAPIRAHKSSRPWGAPTGNAGSGCFEDVSGRVDQDAEAPARVVKRDPVTALVFAGAAFA